MPDRHEVPETQHDNGRAVRTSRFEPADREAEFVSAGSVGGGLAIERHFTRPGIHPFDEIEWERRTAAIKNACGEVIFEQRDVEVPADWSMLATNVVASKYFYGELGTGERENSLRQLIHRVTRTIADWGQAGGYFATERDAATFYNELTHLCVHQYGAFNSPVWFNVGLYQVCGIKGSRGNYRWDPQAEAIVRSENAYEFPQCSACFIQAVEDNMESIMGLARSEAMLFKYGSGTGTDLSPIRSSREKLAGGGKPSGPLSFMRVYDQVAAVVKSGGKTRRAAKMQSLKVNHPDIAEFIEAKLNEEKKAWALIEKGYGGSYNGDAYGSVLFQNSNFSVRASDEFMEAVVRDVPWTTHAVTTGEPMSRYRARELMYKIAEGTHVCGDPGMQFDTTINRWHTCPNSERINASNPCSEYMFVDDSACNLASLNLLKFRRPDGTFDVDGFQHAIRVFVIAQEILVDNGSYPTEKIAMNSHQFRALGLGYANLGSLLMSLGLPYDSNEGRALAGAITAIMSGTAYGVSAELAGQAGPFDRYAENEAPLLRVLNMHRQAIDKIDASACPSYLLEEARKAWNGAIGLAETQGVCNAQVTVLAPTGTIGFMMDCDTTGIEPDIALVKYKLLAGGGDLKIVNRTVRQALEKQGYGPAEIDAIIKHIDGAETIESAPGLREEDLAVFDCALRPTHGQRSIHYMAHLRMMAAVQPFLSGAISKTVNMPNDSTIDDIMQTYIEGWRLGLKALAIYRDGSKRSQPVVTGRKEEKPEPEAEDAAVHARPRRRRLPDTRKSVTHKFDIQGHEGYLTVGFYEDGPPGELFITMAKEGSTIGGLMDVFGTAISMALQYGVPLEDFVRKFAHSRFEPSGFTKNPDIPIAKSIVDYIFRWMGLSFSPEYREANQVKPPQPTEGEQAGGDSPAPERSVTANDVEHLEKAMNASAKAESVRGAEPVDAGTRKQLAPFMVDAPACDVCGAITVRNGTCYKCFNCGNSMGCS